MNLWAKSNPVLVGLRLLLRDFFAFAGAMGLKAFLLVFLGAIVNSAQGSCSLFHSFPLSSTRRMPGAGRRTRLLGCSRYGA